MPTETECRAAIAGLAAQVVLTIGLEDHAESVRQTEFGSEPDHINPSDFAHSIVLSKAAPSFTSNSSTCSSVMIIGGQMPMLS